jgi:hypothetical protein
MNNRVSVSIGADVYLCIALSLPILRLSKAYRMLLPQEKSSHYVKRTAHLHLLARLRIRGALPPLA